MVKSKRSSRRLVKRNTRKNHRPSVKNPNRKCFRKRGRVLFSVTDKSRKSVSRIMYSENISITGVFLETPEPLIPGTRVELRIPRPRKPGILHIDGTVVWRRRDFAYRQTGNKNPGMGIVFDKKNRKGLKEIEQFFEYVHTNGWFL